jgi:hypothetical protein
VEYGNVDIYAGTVVVGSRDLFIAGTGGVTANVGGTFDVNGYDVTEHIDVLGGSLVNNSATAAKVDDVLFNSAKVGGSGDLTFEQIEATEDGGISTLEKIGAGTMTLTEAIVKANSNFNPNYQLTTTVTAGKLQLADNATSAGDEIVIESGGELVVDVGNVTSAISGSGDVSILQNATLADVSSSYSGNINVKNGATLSGALSENSALVLTDNSFYQLDQTRTIGSANVESGSRINLSNYELTINRDLTLIATQDKSAAPIQGESNSKLILASGSTFHANLADNYQLSAGTTTPVYFADGLAGYESNGATIVPGTSRLFRIEGDLQYEGGSLFYNIKRDFASDLFPDISRPLMPVVDGYQGDNAWIERLMSHEDNDSAIERYLQAGSDLVNLSNAMSVIYNTQTSINNIFYARSRQLPIASTRRVNNNSLILGQCDSCNPCDPCESYESCEPCDPCGTYGNYDADDFVLRRLRKYRMNASMNRDFYVSPIYGNNRGFDLKSGNFKYGYENDQWAMGIGVDRLYGLTRVGLLGVFGDGKAWTRGTLPSTNNESSFGGLFLYSSTRRDNFDVLLSAGYLSMENDIEQFTSGGKLTGKLTNSLATVSATLTQTLCYGDLLVLPSFGVEYGYYHQGSLSVRYDNNVVLRNSKAHANLAVIPIGVRFVQESFVFGGRFTPEFNARYIANIGDINATYNTFLIGSPNSALMSTRMADRSAGNIGLGFGWSRRAVSLRCDVGYMFAEHFGDLTVATSASWKF